MKHFSCASEANTANGQKKAFAPSSASLYKREGDVVHLTRIFHESLAATTDMAVLPGVLGCRTLRRTVQVRLGTNPLRLPGGTPILVVSRQQFMKSPG